MKIHESFFNKPLIILVSLVITTFLTGAVSCVTDSNGTSSGLSGMGFPAIRGIMAQVTKNTEVITLPSIPAVNPAVPDVSMEIIDTISPGNIIPTTPLPGLNGADIIVSIQVDNFSIIDMIGEPSILGKGHVHYFLDTVPPIFPDTPAFSAPGTVVEIAANSYTWPNVQPGLHILSAELVNNDHTPFAIPAVASVMVWVPAEVTSSVPQILSLNTEVAMSYITPTNTNNNPSSIIPGNTFFPLSDTTPAPSSYPEKGVANITISIETANIDIVPWLGRSAVAGEGHVHYYIDAIPPTFPVQTGMIVEDTSVHTTDTAYTWVNVEPGVHFFAVELVNSDHTPLSPPVIAASLITIMPTGFSF